MSVILRSKNDRLISSRPVVVDTTGFVASVTAQMTNIYMMDLWCQIPFYDAYLCQALNAEGVACVLGAVSFHREPDYFVRRGLRTDPGLCNIVSRLGIKSPTVRRALRLLEFCTNLISLAVRFLVAPPDIIHVQWVALVAQGSPIESWFLRLAKKRGIKLVYTVHNVLPHDLDVNLKETFGELYRLMDALICHTRETRDRLIEEFGIEAEKISIIPHGPLYYDYQAIDGATAKRRLGLSPENTVVLYQGVLRPYKGLEFLLDAWKNIQARHAHAILVIAGRGEERWENVLRAKVDELGVGASVRLDFRYIPTEEMPIYYQAADVAVYPYREITQSGALMTGIAFGKPIVATALPGFREALEKHQHAFFVEYGDVKALSELLARTISGPLQGENVSSSPASQHSWRLIARQTKACYEKVLDNPSNKQPRVRCDYGVEDNSR